MSIKLRTITGSALTYEDMDRNLSQFFYSSSVHDSGTELRLHFTGSSTLDTPSEEYGATPSQSSRYHSITLGTDGSGGVSKIIAGENIVITPDSGVGEVTISATAGGTGAAPGGSNGGSVQYRVDSSTFGGDTSFFYDSSNKYLGLGTVVPSSRLHLVGDSAASATIRLDALTTGTTKFAQTLIYNGTTKIGAYGKIYSDETASYISTYDNNILHFEHNSSGLLGTSSTKIATVARNGLGIFRENPNRALTVNGAIGISNDASSNTNQSIIQSIPDTIYSSGVLGSGAKTHGVMVSPPLTTVNSEGGHVVVSLSEAGGIGGSATRNSFSIVSSTDETYSAATPVAVFRSNARVGIGTNDPKVALDVVGQVRGTYASLSADTAALGLSTNKVVKVQITGNITFTSSIGSAGTEATVIIAGPGGVASGTITFDSSDFVTTGTMNVLGSNFYTICFVSDGSKWYETSRSTGMT